MVGRTGTNPVDRRKSGGVVYPIPATGDEWTLPCVILIRFFLLLLVRHLFLEAWHLFLEAWHLFLVAWHMFVFKRPFLWCVLCFRKRPKKGPIRVAVHGGVSGSAGPQVVISR